MCAASSRLAEIATLPSPLRLTSRLLLKTHNDDHDHNHNDNHSTQEISNVKSQISDLKSQISNFRFQISNFRSQISSPIERPASSRGV